MMGPGCCRNLERDFVARHFPILNFHQSANNGDAARIGQGMHHPVEWYFAENRKRGTTGLGHSDGRAVTSYTRWVDAVEVMGDENQEVYLTFSPRFEYIWLQCRKRLLDYLAQKPAAIGLRSKYAIRLYAWAKDHLSAET